MNRKWTPEELRTLERLGRKGATFKEIAKELNKTESCVSAKSCRMGFEKVRGYRHSEETKDKIRQTRLGEDNPMWKGDKVGYGCLHKWVKRHKVKPDFCERCKVKPPREVASISGLYKRDIFDYEWLCRKCHMIDDGRIKKFNSKRNSQIKRGLVKRDERGKYC